MDLKSIRSFRIWGISVFDVVTAIVGLVIIFLIAKHFHFPKLDNSNFIWAGILLALPIGIAFHILFGTNTTLNSKLGLSYPPKM
jgi:hypothetical protein